MTDKCIDCIKTRIRAEWTRCLDASANGFCLEKVKIPTDSVVQPYPSHYSHKFRTAQIVKNPGRTVHGRWGRAKWDKKTRTYTIL